MRVPPFYSPLRGIALEDLWHDDSGCPVGRSIAPADCVPKKNDVHKRCPYCALLDEPVPHAPAKP